MGLAVCANLRCFDGDGEDGMTARGGLVHERRPGRPILLSRLQDMVDLADALHDEGGEVLDVPEKITLKFSVKMSGLSV